MTLQFPLVTYEGGAHDKPLKRGCLHSTIFKDPPPSQVQLPSVIRPCLPAKRTYLSGGLSRDIDHRSLRCNLGCSGQQPCTGSTSPSKSSIYRLHLLSWRCRCLPFPFQTFLDPLVPFHPSFFDHSPLFRPAQAGLPSPSICQASRICCGQG